jgi:hypothetical protein
MAQDRSEPMPSYVLTFRGKNDQQADPEQEGRLGPVVHGDPEPVNLYGAPVRGCY